MSYKKDFSYCDIPFSTETPHEDFFFYGAVSNLHSKCESNKHKIIKIRTYGILNNKHGRFYIKEMITTHNPTNPPDPRQSIQVSLAYINRSLRCSSMPYPVQLFGKLQWCGHPVIFAQIIQPLRVSVAQMLHETMVKVSALQCSTCLIDSHELDPS